MAKSANTLAREAFGKRLASLRQSTGITGRAAAKAAGVTEGTWCKWELGYMRPGIDRAPAIAKALNVPIAALYETTDGSTVVAEVRVSAETLQTIREQGTPQADATALRIAQSLSPRLLALSRPARRVTRNVPQTRTRKGPVAVRKAARRLRLEREAAASLRAA